MKTHILPHLDRRQQDDVGGGALRGGANDFSALASQLPVMLRGGVAFVVTCETCLRQVLAADRIGDAEEQILRAHLALHPNTPQPRTLPELLNRFRFTTPPPAA